jgi:hypothetical protein
MSNPLKVILEFAGASTRTGVPPANLMADTLNQGGVKRSRRKVGDGDYWLHVSDLMKTDSRTRFCAREFALHYLERKVYAGAGLSPGFELLFATGHAIHDHARNMFVARSEFRDVAWGIWACPCGRSHGEGHFPSQEVVCRHCRRPRSVYHEIDLFSEKFRIVGHPDWIIKWGKWFHLYEIKTIDRADIDFDAMYAPLGDHTLQATFYYYLMVARGYKVSPELRYLYVDRSTRKLFGGYPYKEFIRRVDPIERLEPFLNLATTLQTSIAERRLPDRICATPTTPRARACQTCISCFERRSRKVDPIIQTASLAST